jgi:hypothetical protein
MRIIRAFFDRLTLLGAVEKPSPSTFIAASALPGDPTELVDSGIIAEWRVSADGERWFSILDPFALSDIEEGDHADDDD